MTVKDRILQFCDAVGVRLRRNKKTHIPDTLASFGMCGDVPADQRQTMKTNARPLARPP